MRRLAAVASGVVFLPVASAQAGPAFTLTNEPGAGTSEVAVDSAGTAHVVWASPVDGDPDRARLRYCRVPAGAQACAVTRTIFEPEPGGSVLGWPRVFTDPADKVVIVAVLRSEDPNMPEVGAFTSADDFAAGTLLATGTNDDLGRYYFAALGPGPGEAVSLAEHGNDTPYVRSSLAGPPQASWAELENAALGDPEETPAATFGNELAVAAGSIPVLTVASTHKITADQFRLSVAYTSHTGGGDPNSSSNWRPWQFFEGEFPWVAGGPAGAVVAYGRDGIYARKLDTASGLFGPEVRISNHRSFAFVSANPVSGAFMHAFAVDTGVDAGESVCVAGSGDGLAWSRPVAIAGGVDATNLRAAAAADWRGIAVWQDLNANAIMAASLEPVANTLCEAEAEINEGHSFWVEMLGRKKLPVSRKRIVKIRLRCDIEEGAPSSGQLKLRTRKRVQVRRGAKRRAVIAKKPFTIGAGSTTRVRIRLSKSKLRLVKRHRGARKITASAHGRNAQGQRRTVLEKKKLVP